MDSVVIRPDEASFRRVVRALDDEADGREWRRELAEELHEALQPGVIAVRSSIMSMASAGLEHAGEPLRSAVAGNVVTDIRLGASGGGARIRVRRTGLPRGFANAPKRLNGRSGWRHPVFGPDVWVRQIGKPGWFDDTLRALRPKLRQSAQKALQSRADRIARRSK